ncbi:hypothetical protein ETW23_07715 [Leisingera sp. NJS201]|uniref:hypothetical protein n=1 Tax=Leisingera sp. NJS201 TaxID=2508306 RepID=UPI001070F14C|nr:hypothetical protein [Leisingera sp. NJS201]QBR36043.1 hypothetical protein ETW23_07715 [Leisingera sp. NJS201]
MIRVLALTAAIALGLFVQPAAAAAQCYARFDELAAVLFEHHGEAPAAEMLAKNGNAIHLFVSPDTGAWTISATAPGGAACVLGHSNAFQAIGAAAPEPAGELH